MRGYYAGVIQEIGDGLSRRRNAYPPGTGVRVPAKSGLSPVADFLTPIPMAMRTAATAFLLATALALGAPALALAQQCPAVVPTVGAPPPGPLPLFPATNWWNADISAAPVDTNSASYIAFINNGGTRKLHPDFGGEASPGSVDIYGMPYVIVDGTQPKVAVTFDYWDESDGVNMATGQGVPFYPLPTQAITQPHWVEGGAPANIDQRDDSDRHLIVIDCTNRGLYELYNVYYNPTQARWYAGSGAYFDMNTDNRRPDTWTSADAAGLAILPGLVRYDEAWNPAITDIGHAFRVTVRATNGYVYPASHRAGSTAGALPMGARLRLKASVNGVDPVTRVSDPNLRKIFRAMQKHGLIVADNGSDMYITGTFDTRWSNDILNPAFAQLTASDFEVIKLGWQPTSDPPPPPPPTPQLDTLTANPNTVIGGASATGTVTLTIAAPSGGAVVGLSSASSAVSVPASVTVAANATSANFTIDTSSVTATTATSITASYAGATRSATFTVNPAPPPPPAPTLSALTLSRSSVNSGGTFTATVKISAAAPSGGVQVALKSSNTLLVAVPASVTIAEGTSSKTITLTAGTTRRNTSVSLSAILAGVSKTATITVKR
jgi:hypothetical protein